ncbi:MAG: AMIN domain-containing protein [candidate division WOR-3 bacterium]|nr:AMIN domain-containing protein [candidate division WOR-3 bacterium]MCX7757634.1 AMIN domain-containing protein [candidate division WOR-3 bacterium]MDW7987458.1 AMIN domain-containing protein [candidate division WOR-3 bacterium]
MKIQKNILLLLAFIFLLALSKVSGAELVTIKSVTWDLLKDYIRITVYCDNTPQITSFALSDPERIVVDFQNTNFYLEDTFILINTPPVLNAKLQLFQEEIGFRARLLVTLDRRAEYKVFREEKMVIVDIDLEKIRPKVAKEDVMQEKISIYVKDADVVDLLRMLSKQFGLNVIITPDVKASITVILNEVPLMQAIDVLVRAADCNYIKYESGIILIKPKAREIPGELESRIYELNYAEATDVEKAIKRALSARGEAEIVYRRVGEGGQSKRASAIIVTDYPEVLDKLQTIIAQLDKPTPQIAIEAKFIETTLTSDNMFGINWSLRTSVTAAVPSSGEMAIPIKFQEFILGKLNFSQLAAALEIMQNQGKSKLIANPKTITLDNQTAEINMGVSVPLRTVKVDPQTQERTYTWTEKFIPIGLKVTPHVTADSSINMEIEPRVEAITGWQGSPEDMRPVTVRREAKTQVVVKDGEVVVIGGLIKDEENRVRSKIPVLGDIPLIGDLLFTRTTIKREKSELLIFIIPRIIYQ